MSIAIYTYRDPYLFEQEPFWNEIKSCPYFCASQTLVNGMKAVYLEDFQQGRVTTVQNLIDAAYHDWIDTPRAIRQYAVIDNVIVDLLGSFEGDLAKENVLRALQFNRGEVFKSIRTLFELAVNPDHIKAESLTPEQTLLVEIYRRILRSDSIEAFTLPADLEESTSFEELTRIAFRDLKILMKRNDNFYNAVIALSSELVDYIIEDAKDYMEHDRKDCTFLKNVHSLEDFLNSGFYGNYDDSRKYFISVFLDCFYYEVFEM